MSEGFKWLDSGERGGRDFELDGSRRRVTGALWLPQQCDATTPMMLMGHGASGDRYQAPIPHLAQRFVAEAGISVLAIDGPVHGLRSVAPGGREAVAVEMRRSGFVQDMVADWLDAFQTVCTQANIGKGRLGYFGLSMGTFFGLPLLASRLEFSTAVIGLAGTSKAGKPIAAELLRAAAEVTHPVLFLMQLEDELFPRDGYLELFDALKSEDKRIHANPGLHPEVPAEEVAHSFDFLRAHLEGPVERSIVNPLAE
ncbi:MAG: hypothetical protein GKR90_09225 [Pseudomonadales bacterium]|nr:hypothetical protein [Pseudomonadales bacterium]